MDRAHRLGQKKVVTVYRLLMRGTLEERIMSLQQFKRDIANAVVNADNVATDKMEVHGVVDIMAASAGPTATSKHEEDSAREYNDLGMSAFLDKVDASNWKK